MKKNYDLCLLVFFIVILNVKITAQSNPLPFDLSISDYNWAEWQSTELAGTYPPNMMFHCIKVLDGDINSLVSKDWALAYNLSSKARINGRGSDGITFLNANSTNEGANWVGAAILSLNTINRTNIIVSWLAGFYNLNGTSNRQYRIRLQYRIGDTGDFQDLIDNNRNTIEYKFDFSQSIGDTEHFSNTLPEVLEDQPIIQLRWKYFQFSGSSGNRPELRLDDIHVSSESSLGLAKKLLISEIIPNQPMANLPFSLKIIATDYNNIPRKFSQNTAIKLSLRFNSDSITGIINKVIQAGDHSIVFDDLIYNKNESVNIIAEVISGELIDSDTKTINFALAPTKLKIINLYPKTHTGIPLPSFFVYALNNNNEIVEYYNNYDITIYKFSGNGNIINNYTKPAINGIAVFDDIAFDSDDDYQISAKAININNCNIENIKVNKLPSLSEIIIPKYMKSNSIKNTNLPSYCLIKLDNLHQNTTYRYISGARSDNYPFIQTDEGAGYNIHYNENNLQFSFNNNKSKYLNDESNYSVFTTSEHQTEKYIWINLVPDDNECFNENNNIYWILSLANEKEIIINRYKTINTTKTLEFGYYTDKATGIADKDSWINPYNYICLYTKINNNDIPISTAIVQPDGIDINNAIQYYKDLDEQIHSWATLIPNNLNNGITKIEEYSPTGELLKTWTDNDGIWANVSTINPNGGSDMAINNFETPQIKIINPIENNTNTICNNDFNTIQWQAHGIDLIDIFISIDNGNNYTKLMNSINAKNNSIRWTIQRGFYVNNSNRLLLKSQEHEFIVSSTLDFNIVDAPRIIEQSQSNIYCLNEDIELYILANGTDLKYQWKKDGIDINNSNNSNSSVLLINKAEYDSQGLYNCVCSGDSSCENIYSDDISVSFATPPAITNQPNSIITGLNNKAIFTFDAHVGTLMDLNCIEIQWYKDANILIDDDRIAGAKSNYLTIKNLKESDFSNNYYAFVSGLCASTFTNKVSLVREIQNAFIIDYANRVFCRNNNQYCNLCISDSLFYEYKGKKLYKWYKNGMELYDNNKVSGTQTNKLTIYNIDEDDIGNYYVKLNLIDTSLILYSDIVELELKDTATIILQPVNSIIAQVGKTLSISTLAFCKQDLNYQWYKDTDIIFQADSSIYEKSNINTNDEGKYYCAITDLECNNTIYTDTCFVSVVNINISSINKNYGNTIKQKEIEYFYLNSQNPADKYIRINYKINNTKFINIKLIDGLSKEVLLYNDISNNNNEIIIDIEKYGLVSGCYNLILQTENEVRTNKLIIIK